MDTKSRLIRWVLLLQEFDVEIKDKIGAENVTADHLSLLESTNQGGLSNQEINDSFPKEHLHGIQELALLDIPWFADFANYLLGKVLPKGLTF